MHALTALQTIRDDPEHSQEIQMQDRQMHLLFTDISEDFMREMCHEHTNRSFYTNMRGVTVDIHCRVEAIAFIGIGDIGQMRLEHLPNTVQRLEVIACDQCYSVETRYLPRKLEYFNLSHNKIYGSVDLTALPTRMTEFDMRINRITGKVNILRLPRTMTRLFLHNNRIIQYTVYFDEVPECFMVIDLHGNKVKRVRHVSGMKDMYEARIIIRPYGF